MELSREHTPTVVPKRRRRISVSTTKKMFRIKLFFDGPDSNGVLKLIKADVDGLLKAIRDHSKVIEDLLGLQIRARINNSDLTALALPEQLELTIKRLYDEGQFESDKWALRKGDLKTAGLYDAKVELEIVEFIMSYPPSGPDQVNIHELKHIMGTIMNKARSACNKGVTECMIVMCEQFKNSPKALDDEPQAVFDAFGPPNAVTREDGTFDYANCPPVWEMEGIISVDGFYFAPNESGVTLVQALASLLPEGTAAVNFTFVCHCIAVFAAKLQMGPRTWGPPSAHTKSLAAGKAPEHTVMGAKIKAVEDFLLDSGKTKTKDGPLLFLQSQRQSAIATARGGDAAAAAPPPAQTSGSPSALAPVYRS